MEKPVEDRFFGCLLGLACGDAVGTTVEFYPRGTFAPVRDMVGGGPFALEPGQWTDDTSMALCLAESLIVCAGFDPRDQMARYWRWYEEGYWSATGSCFDIGNTVLGALLRFRQSGEPFSGSTNPNTAGNGCIMRLAPVPLYYYPQWEKAVFYAGESAKTTHGALECVEACRLLADLLVRALNGEKKENLLRTDLDRITGPPLAIRSEKIAAIARGDFLEKPVDQIRGSGYVVESLEAALYCFARTESFEAAVLMAANLGDDADTTAAVCGQIAGAYYGESGIPHRWLEKLAMAERIRALAQALFHGPALEKEPPSRSAS
ncbi:ADP-ribosylglycohydrolase family protein [Desulfosoma sp.]